MKYFLGTMKHLLIGLFGMLLVLGGWLVQALIHFGITAVICLAISFSLHLLLDKYIDFTYVIFGCYTLLAVLWYFKINLFNR